ncbi:hypothetical protein AAG906_027010 [Vitis piasezkii]
MGSRQAEHNRGHAILNKLENVCLLDRCENGKYVKLHDVIRDMVINIKSSRFMVKIRRNFKNLPSELEWSNNLERVQLMGRELSTLKPWSSGLVIYRHCSPTKSICDMVNLRALILCHCEELKQVGSLAKLKELRELDLSWSGMEAIPNGIEKLVLLEHFSWISHDLRNRGADWIEKVGDPLYQSF